MIHSPKSTEALVDALAGSQPEDVFHLEGPGIYRLTAPLLEKHAQTFIGFNGAVISGAKLLTGFGQEGGAWVAYGQYGGQPVYGDPASVCWPGSTRCNYPEDLWIDNRPQLHVNSFSAGGPGKFYHDRGAGKVFFWTNPANKVVEFSTVPTAFAGGATDVSLKGDKMRRELVFEKFASPYQSAAVRLGTRWQARRIEVRLNHSNGLSGAPNTLVSACDLHHNLEMNIGGPNWSGSIVEGCKVGFGNYMAWHNGSNEGGNSKFTWTDGIVIRNNYFNDAYGPSIWLDINNRNFTVEHNTVARAWLEGIFQEIGYGGLIRGNYVTDAGLSPLGNLYTPSAVGAGICVHTSSDVEVTGNRLDRCHQGIIGVDSDRRSPAPNGIEQFGPWILRNLHVHHNCVTHTTSDQYVGRSGIVGHSHASNRYTANHYNRPSVGQVYVHGDGNAFTWAQWQAAGHDVGGTNDGAGVFAPPINHDVAPVD